MTSIIKLQTSGRDIWVSGQLDSGFGDLGLFPSQALCQVHSFSPASLYGGENEKRHSESTTLLSEHERGEMMRGTDRVFSFLPVRKILGKNSDWPGPIRG